MKRWVLAVASALVDAGVKAGDAVIVISENRVEWIYCDVAIQRFINAFGEEPVLLDSINVRSRCGWNASTTARTESTR